MATNRIVVWIAAAAAMLLVVIFLAGIRFNFSSHSALVGPDEEAFTVLFAGGDLEMLKIAVASSERSVEDIRWMEVSLLSHSVAMRRIDIVEWILTTQDVDVNGASGPPLFAPLTIAISNDDVDMIKLLLDHGADLDFDRGGELTSREVAELKGNKCVLDMLRQADPRGAEPTIHGRP